MPPKKGKGKEGKPAPGAAAAKAMMAAAADQAKTAKPKKPPPPPACFSPDDLQKFKEIFKLFDEDNIEKVKIEVIPFMLRKLGFNPKGEELKTLYATFLEDEYVDTVELHEWYFMVEAKMQMGDDFELAVTKAFAALGHDDEETGFCDIQVLREELQTWGEPLSDLEFIDWPKLAIKDKTLNIDTGVLCYTKFIENMNNKDIRFVQEPINFFKLDQRTLMEMAIKKAAEEKAEEEKKEAEKKARDEARRQKMIADGLLPPDQ